MIAPTTSSLHFGRRLVLAHPDPEYTALIRRQLGLLGWEVHRADSGPDARRLAQLLAPAAVVLAAELPSESGWLTCAKLTQQDPGCKVILVGRQLTEENHRFAVYVGAVSLVDQRQGIRGLFDALCGTVLPAVG